MPPFITEHPQFFTASINGWQNLLEPDKHKDIIVSSLKFLVDNKRIKLFAFVIMSNHIHLIWQMHPLIHPSHVQRDFLKYTAQRIKYSLQQNDEALLVPFHSTADDRYYNFWKRRPLSIELRTPAVYMQKLHYIHNNPVKAGCCILPELYKYSSATFYQRGADDRGFLSHHRY